MPILFNAYSREGDRGQVKPSSVTLNRPFYQVRMTGDTENLLMAWFIILFQWEVWIIITRFNAFWLLSLVFRKDVNNPNGVELLENNISEEIQNIPHAIYQKVMDGKFKQGGWGFCGYPRRTLVWYFIKNQFSCAVYIIWKAINNSLISTRSFYRFRRLKL